MPKSALYAHFDGMTWPRPEERLDELERELRYGPNENLNAASVISAYRRLVLLPRRERERIVRKLRAEMNNENVEVGHDQG